MNAQSPLTQEYLAIMERLNLKPLPPVKIGKATEIVIPWTVRKQLLRKGWTNQDIDETLVKMLKDATND